MSVFDPMNGFVIQQVGYLQKEEKSGSCDNYFFLRETNTANREREENDK